MLSEISNYLNQKQHIRLHEIADLEMRILYFKKRPFVVLDFCNGKIYFNERELESVKMDTQGKLAIIWIRSKYLPSKNWIGLDISISENNLIIQLIDDFYLATYNLLLRNK